MRQYDVEDVPALPHWINGHAYIGSVDNLLPVEDVATQEVLRQVACADSDDFRAALTSAQSARTHWLKMGAVGRAQCLQSVVATMLPAMQTLRYRTHFSQLIQQETGKDKAAAQDEIAQFLQHLEQYGLAHDLPTATDETRVICLHTGHHTPLLDLLTEFAGLYAGEVQIIMPDLKAPSIALAYAELLTRGGCPPGVVNVLQGTMDVSAFSAEVVLRRATTLN